MRKQGSCLKKETMQGTVPGACRRGRPRTARMDNIKTWTGLPVEESIRMTEDRDERRKYVDGVAKPQIEDSIKTEQNTTHVGITFLLDALSLVQLMFNLTSKYTTQHG